MHLYAPLSHTYTFTQNEPSSEKDFQKKTTKQRATVDVAICCHIANTSANPNKQLFMCFIIMDYPGAPKTTNENLKEK